MNLASLSGYCSAINFSIPLVRLTFITQWVIVADKIGKSVIRLLAADHVVNSSFNHTLHKVKRVELVLNSSEQFYQQIFWRLLTRLQMNLKQNNI